MTFFAHKAVHFHARGLGNATVPMFPSRLLPRARVLRGGSTPTRRQLLGWSPRFHPHIHLGASRWETQSDGTISTPFPGLVELSEVLKVSGSCRFGENSWFEGERPKRSHLAEKTPRSGHLLWHKGRREHRRTSPSVLRSGGSLQANRDNLAEESLGSTSSSLRCAVIHAGSRGSQPAGQSG